MTALMYTRHQEDKLHVFQAYVDRCNSKESDVLSNLGSLTRVLSTRAGAKVSGRAAHEGGSAAGSGGSISQLG